MHLGEMKVGRFGNVLGLNLEDPPQKDTIAVPRNGYVVLRLKADNPGNCLLIRGDFYFISNSKIRYEVSFKQTDYLFVFIKSNLAIKKHYTVCFLF